MFLCWSVLDRRDVGRAIETFDEIERSFNLKPNVRSYDAVLRCCIENGHTLGAMSFMEEMREQGVSHVP
jgi:pentatricopeptide repeat protein